MMMIRKVPYTDILLPDTIDDDEFCYTTDVVLLMIPDHLLVIVLLLMLLPFLMPLPVLFYLMWWCHTLLLLLRCDVHLPLLPPIIVLPTCLLMMIILITLYFILLFCSDDDMMMICIVWYSIGNFCYWWYHYYRWYIHYMKLLLILYLMIFYMEIAFGGVFCRSSHCSPACPLPTSHFRHHLPPCLPPHLPPQILGISLIAVWWWCPLPQPARFTNLLIWWNCRSGGVLELYYLPPWSGYRYHILFVRFKLFLLCPSTTTLLLLWMHCLCCTAFAAPCFCFCFSLGQLGLRQDIGVLGTGTGTVVCLPAVYVYDTCRLHGMLLVSSLPCQFCVPAICPCAQHIFHYHTLWGGIFLHVQVSLCMAADMHDLVNMFILLVACGMTSPLDYFCLCRPAA